LKCSSYCVTIGGSVYLPDAALLTSFFCGIHDNLKIMEEMIYLALSKVGEMVADLYISLQTALQKHNLKIKIT
jgi:hypothetical protein